MDKNRITLIGRMGTDITTKPATPATQSASQTLVLKKTEAGWKVDGGSFFNLPGEPADRIASRVALARKLTVVADAVAKDIAAGKFFSVGDAYQEYWSRSLQAAAAATSASSTATATAPESLTKP